MIEIYLLSTLSQLEPYNRPTATELHSTSSSSGIIKLLFASGFYSVFIWILIAMAYFLICSFVPTGISGDLAKALFKNWSNKLKVISLICSVAIVVFCSIFASVQSHKQILSKPHMSKYLGVYEPDKQISGNQSVVFGISQLKVTPHEIYGYLNGQKVFDFHYYHDEYYHPLFLNNNQRCTGIRQQFCHTKSLTLKHDGSISSGILLVGYYRYNKGNLASQVYDSFDDASSPINEYSNYGIVKKHSRDTHKLYPITNAGHKFKLPKPNTTMIMSTNKKAFGINPLGARTINDTGSGAIDGIYYKPYGNHQGPMTPDADDFAFIKK